MTYDLTFTNSTDAADYFAALSFRRLPTAGTTLAANGYDDKGRPIITFARQHLANRLAYTFTEQPRRS